MSGDQEKVLYEGTPSQVLNYNTYVMCGLLLLVVIYAPSLWQNVFVNYFPNHKAAYILIAKILFFAAFFIGFKAWLEVKSHKYKLTTERFTETVGILSRTTQEVELFRVRDITFSEPFSLRMMGCGDIILDTSDKNTPIVVLHAIKNARPVLELIRKHVDIMRTKKGVREIEM